MKTKTILFIALTIFASSVFAKGLRTTGKKSFHSFTVKTIDGKTISLSKYAGKKILVVNVASNCGLTPQYKILQEIYEKMDTSKYVILGFPANNFLEQEPGSNEEILNFCKKNYGVTFPIMEKVSVCNYVYKSYPTDTLKAEKTTTSEIYRWLTEKNLNGVADTKMQWNFQKFLINEKGELIGSLPPSVSKEILLLESWFSGTAGKIE